MGGKDLLYGDSSTRDDGKFKEDDHKKEVHECVEHDHKLVIVEDFSTSWSSDDDDQSTTSSLDEIDGSSSSDTNDDSTSSNLMVLMMVHAQTMIVMLL